MSFHTIFVVIHDGKAAVAPSTSADEALRYFREYGFRGEIYACYCSLETAVRVRETGSIQILKQLSHSMMKVGDVT